MGEDRPREPAGGSTSHERAVLRQDNGELQEDVVETRELDRSVDPPPPGTSVTSSVPAGDEPDESSRDSFPASDPPSSWAGGEEDPGAQASHGAVTRPSVQNPRGPAERVIERGPISQVPERKDPADPVPRTLPRH